MPNWCNGALKVRGEKEDVLRFLKEGLKPVGYLGETKQPEIEEDECSITIKSDLHALHINGTRRCFVERTVIEWWYDQILVLDVECAWAVDVEGLAKVSEKYNLDFKIYAFEKGMEFNQDIEIHRGKVIKDDEIQFHDYEWECIDPRIGG
ncbi:hypothetical protein P9G84_31875 [Brevibacillus centrosporus]|uniref:hypothetical protein n=1 Tax=Brevibacillus centrosporus TaxID=54910 RepID=UPI000F09B511|nr:hypothetical protein [Brevibacillus centrosporus]MEC2133451.1 hypothetical protein [Brevibacillus centrosporus]RNB63168.1 hypothetical protein EDM55_29335 [Brevibacillus centrosporus]GED35010.1 hypothetical protein BCE02nite_61510 [Brevibacillus centrosporus]